MTSYDARHGSWNLGARWSDQTEFGPRAYFQLSSSPAELRVEDIQEAEAGIYRCRVDYRNSPTKNVKLNLTIIGEIEQTICTKCAIILPVQLKSFNATQGSVS